MAAPNRGLADLSDNDRQELEAWLVDFDQRWGEGALPERARRLPPTNSWRLPALREMVKIDLERQWALGNRISLEAYLQEYPELGNPSDVSADLIQAEYEVRKQFGARAELLDYARRFPAQVNEVRRLIASGRSAMSLRTTPPSNHNTTEARQHIHANSIPELPEQFGRYRILNRLGAGGMGSVYLAEDTRLKRKVALKVAHIGGPEGRQVLERFYREAEAAAGLDHPYLCKVYDVGEVEGVHYLTMEYIEGTTLDDFVAGRKDLSQRQVAAIVGKLALALQDAHAKGVVHRDLKPANVMIKKTGQRTPVIVDFGLAQQISAGRMRLTQTGQAMGTPHYMAVEQVKGDLDAIGPACDIYALGVILYELLTGQIPFDGPNPIVVIAQILTTEAAPPSTHRPNLDPKLGAICMKAMAKEAEDRYASMTELAAALSEYIKAPQGMPEPLPIGRAASPRPAAAPPRQQGSDTLMGQFFEKLAAENAMAPISDRGPKAKAKSISAAVLVPGVDAQGSGMLRPILTGIGVACAVILLGAVIYLATDNGRVTITVDGPKFTIKVDGDEVRLDDLDGPITLRSGEHALTIMRDGSESQTRKFVVRRGQDEPLRIEYSPQPAEEKSARSKFIAEPNPWPGALALTGQTLPFKGVLYGMSRDARRVATYNDSKGVQVFEAPDASKVVEIEGLPRLADGRVLWMDGADFSPDGKYIAVSVHDSPARIWEVATGEEVRRTSLSPGTSITWSPDGKRIAVAGRHRTIVSVGYASTGDKIFDLGPHSALTNCVAFSPDSRRLASGSGVDPRDTWAGQFGTGIDLKIWDLETGTGSALEGHPMRISSVAFSPDGRRLASAGCDKTVKVWDVATKKCLVTFNKHQAFVSSVRFSPDGRLIASVGEEIPVRVWDSATGREIAILAGLPGNPEFVQFSLEGRWIYAGARSTLKAWETPNADQSKAPDSAPNLPTPPPPLARPAQVR